MRSGTLGIVLLVVTFLVGGLAGAASLRALNAAEPDPAPRADCGEHRGEHRGKWLERIDLSPEQRVQVDRVMQRRHVQMREFWDNEGSRLRAIVDSTRNEIRALLTPAQRAEYDRLRAERKAVHEARKKSGSRNTARE